MDNNRYEVLIIGGGISGSALAYQLSRYTDVKTIGVVEKYNQVGLVNTKATSNSQTIHVGDIETNYTIEKARITKKTAKMVELYCKQYGYENEIIFSHQKMALGVGEEEVKFIQERYDSFCNDFSCLQLWDKEKLKDLEPKIVFDEYGNERKEPIIAMGSQGEWTTVDYGKMAVSLIDNAKKQEGKTVDLHTNTKVDTIEELSDGGFCVKSNQGDLYADYVVVNAGAHSLFLAHKMGYGLDFGSLSIAGSFYLTKKKLLNGKVYMVQNPKLPFAALHGDPDILADGCTRFGPTALALPKLERYIGGTFFEFLKTLRFDSTIMGIFWDLLKDSDIRNYIFRNFLFEIPGINKSLFIKDARKIVPSLKASDITYAKGFGGVRPQVLNKTEKKLMLGEASVKTGKGILFNMTPSPGATSCLGNGLRDLREVVGFLNKNFDEDKFNRELTVSE